MTFAERLAAAQLTATQIAARAQVPLRTAYAWLAGTNTPRPLTLAEIERRLQLKP